MRFNIKKLWKIFIIQLILICIFVLFGKTFIANPGDEVLQQLDGNVKFIDSKYQEPQDADKKTASENGRKFQIFRHPFNFSDLFYTFNQTISYGNDIDEHFTVSRHCFREGSSNLNENISRRAFYNNKKLMKKNDTKTEIVDDYFSNGTSLAISSFSQQQEECECHTDWHGKDCGLPEVIWRAFMKSQQPLKPAKLVKTPHNLFYIINFVSSINLETLEIQVMELIDVVNLFILCDVVKSDDPTKLLRHQMNQGFLRDHKEQILLVKDDSCSAQNVYRKAKKLLAHQMRPQDVLIYSKPDEILSRKALHYFKWYENWPQPVKFRLKYNVYGFFFKHPENTIIGSMACQLNILEQFYKSDPELILNSDAVPFVIGDLNHPGGFYCEYCYQPIDIIKQLNIINSSFNTNIFQQNTVINIEYVQSLITKGLYIDGKLELIKLKHYHEKKYYMPDYVAKNRWKFDNIAVNLFASWDTDLDNNDYLF